MDASVAVKWVSPEPGSERALALLDQWGRGAEVWVPDLFFAECASALRHKVVYGPVEAADAREMLRALVGIGARVVSSQALAEEALELALETGLTVWDACYLAVARQADAVLWTADRELRDKGRRAYEAIELVG